VDEAELYDRYEAIFEGIEPPFAFVDLDALGANADSMLARAGGKPIRVASKSVRCRAILDRVAARSERFQGILAYTLPEALMLAGAGHRDVVVAYPTADRHAISRLAELTRTDPEARITLMVDEAAQLDLIEGAVGSGAAVPIRVAIDVDVGYRALRGLVQAGPKRSPIRTPEAARKLAAEIDSRPGLMLDGLMAYEGQVAGVGDAAPGKAMRNLAIRRMQRASMAELAERRAAIVAAVAEVAPLRFVNGGGTGSLELTAREEAVTELAAGSGLYAPALFDDYSRFSLRPAAGFALPIVRRPDTGVATALGGGYVASGAPGADRLPSPWLPPGLHLDRFEGAGEVQTPLLGEVAVRLKVGHRVYFRHAKAGELCEHFNELHLVSGDGIAGTAPTYRGEGYAFL
jgi:D-serine deaminase-like pyridoxal phosphate-dependent protein